MVENTQKELSAAIIYVEDAQKQLGEGNIVILQSLQENVAKICETIASLPIEQGREYREQMLELSDKMQALEIDLRAKKHQQEPNCAQCLCKSWQRKCQ
jgi:hypothetical protein